jgi:hypothetical protein
VAELGQACQTQDHHAGTGPITTLDARIYTDSNLTPPQDRPDLIESELSGLAFDSNQQIFKTAHIDIMFSQTPPTPVLNEAVYTFIDPAAGGPQSDYAVVSVTRQKGMLTVSARLFCLLFQPEDEAIDGFESPLVRTDLLSAETDGICSSPLQTQMPDLCVQTVDRRADCPALRLVHRNSLPHRRVAWHTQEHK